jgi:transketolase
MKIPNPRSLSRLGPRGTFGLALLELANENQNVVGLSADLAITAGMDRFRSTLPDRFFNVGIAEQNLIGVAAGLAEDGKLAFAVTFANFAALRSCEFVRHHLGYMQQNVVVVGIGAGFAMGQFGTTHYSIEDIGALRSIPNLTIISPADGTEIFEAIEAISKSPRPTYLRLNGAPGMAPVDQSGTSFEIGKARTIKTGSDVCVIASGSMVSVAIDVSEKLATEGISAAVINMHTVKPLDQAPISNAMALNIPIVTIEEHSVVGGLGSAVAEVIAESNTTSRLLRIGIEDKFPKVGSYQYVLEQTGLTSVNASKKISNFLNRN